MSYLITTIGIVLGLTLGWVLLGRGSVRDGLKNVKDRLTINQDRKILDLF